MIVTVRQKLLIRSLPVTSFLLILLAWSAPQAAQTPHSVRTQTNDEVTATDAKVAPAFKDYKDVHIGMSADRVRERLGEPELRDKDQDLFLISDDEMVQVVYDKEGKVNTVSITYSGNNEAAPTALAVLGEDVAAAADGRVYKLVKYPSVGYWVAYSRTAGDALVVSITMKKM